ncbi:phage tail tape measure protein [Pseudoflavonifractor sp. 524-17]|uniref:tape measure protein n=1 Tax=Pseudoflavonifractor sp. 524-17 TaxID=2304577 RepID=UPI00137A1C2F|nr:tape measure protein [Pseudoflavonifractor sp. 524-17]NCE64067.1 phage tail tape measure protein [Pseudoflavonifractor sp. 524-17]
MSTTIDERVVEMRFDNKQFEENVQTSLTTLGKLKQGLDLNGAAKGLEGLGDAAKKCSLSTLSSSVEGVKAKFSALEVMAITALSNITNSAVNAGKRMIASFTVEPVSSGFDEYELKMGSIQTIMASTGESLDKVNQKLDELNTYSDRTIYSFADMTSNIGKFTNAGVKLDDAVAAIQGVSNVAAVSGANANEASRAMYNFAQALSAGYVKLIDWKSIENANMATVEFKTQLLEAAVAAGTLTKTADGMYQVLTKNGQGALMKETIDATHMFNDSLAYQWMTTEVLTETLKDYADETTEIGKKAFAAAQDVKTFSQLLDTLKESAQSGWAETWQLIVGDYEEAKVTLREFSEFFSSIIDGSSEARNSLLGGALMSSWGQLKNKVGEAGFSVDAFRDTLRETASESVEGLDKMIEEAGSFDATLSQGWLTTDILAETLDRLANEATGTTGGISALSDEQLKNIGYTEAQIEALRSLSSQANSSTGELADLVQNMTRKSGRELLFDSILNSAKAIQKVFGTLKGAWDEVFPPVTSERLYGLLEGLNKFTQGLILSDETADKIGRTFKGLFAVLDLIRQGFSAAFKMLSPLLGGIGTLSGGILDATASLGDWLVGIDEAAKKGDIFNKACQSISEFIRTAGLRVKEFIQAVKEDFKLPGFEMFQSFLGRAQARIGQLIDAIGGMGSEVTAAVGSMSAAFADTKFFQALQKLYNGAKTIGSAIVRVIGGLAASITEKLGNADFNGAIDLLNGISFGAIAAGLIKFLGTIKESFDDLGGFLDNVKGILDGVRGCLEAYQTQLKAGALLKIAGAIAILAAAIVVISLIDSDKLAASLASVTVLFADLMGSMAIFGKVGGEIKGVIKACAAMLAISTSVLILASALKKIASLDAGQLAVGLTGIGGLMAELVASVKVMGSGSGSVVKGAAQMVIFAGAIKVLASVCADLAELEWEPLARGLTGVGVLLAEVSLFLNTAKFNGKSVATAAGIVILAGAMKILASACKDFRQMNWDELAKGLASIGALLLEVAAFTKLTGNAKHVVATGFALIEIAAAMKLFAAVMASFGGMSWDQIAKGLTAMGIALADIAVAANLMPKNMAGVGAGMIAVGAALEIMAHSLKKMGGMSWDEIAKGLVAMGLALAELAVGLNLMNGTLAGSAALLIAAGALALLTPTLVVLGAMSWDAIAKGLLTLAGAFSIIGAAGALLAPLIPSILGFAGSVALIGAGILGIGAGLLAIGAGLSATAIGITALATSLGAGTAIIVAGLTAIITGIAAVIPAVAEKLGEAVIAFCKVITEGAPAIGEAVKTLVLTWVDVMVECVPALAEGALELLAGVLSALVAYTPQIVDSLMQFLIEVLEGIARNLPALIQAAVDVLMAFFSGVIDALSGIDTGVLLKGIAGIGLLSAIMLALGATAALVPGAMAGVLGMGAVITELALVLAAIGGLAQIPGLSWLISEGGTLLEGVGTAIGSFVGGIVGGFMSGVSSQFPQIGADLSAFMTNLQPFIEGAGSITPDMLSGVKALTEVILLLTAADILDGLTSWLTGGSSLADFADQLVPFGEAMSRFSESVAGMDADLVSKAAIAGKTFAEMAATLPNSGGVVSFFAGDNDMKTFGNQLGAFGDAMVNFADKVKGLDSDTVVNAATAGKAMAEMAATLPNSGGVVGFFAGENDMAAFGQQLTAFGVAIKNYSLTVKGLDGDAVANSAAAGKAMVELANTLPNCGGVVGFFAGENNLDTFGTQLLSFGTSIKGYSQAVKGLDADTVMNSASAGKALVELANTLPNCGGLVSFFTGENSIAAFGEDLVLFGGGLAAYASAIRNVKPDAVTASANAAGALSNLAAGLPDSSLFDQWFGGDQTLASFGDDIAVFGEDMGYYYAQISGADPAKLSAVITQVWALVDLAKGVKDIDRKAFSNFGKSLRELADVGITGFTDAFCHCDESVDNAVAGMLDMVGASISSNKAVIAPAMEEVMGFLAETMNETAGIVNTAAAQIMTGFSAAIQDDGRAAESAVSTVLTDMVKTLNGGKDSFVDAGKNVSQGFINGINSKLIGASAAGRRLGLAALNAAKQALDSHSPSREFIHLGENIGEGLAIGVNNSIVPAASATSDMIGQVIKVSRKGIKAFKEWAEEKKYYGELSLKDELAGWENLQSKYKAGSKERKEIDREVYRLQNELVSSTYQNSVDWIEEEKYYNRLSLEEELAAWERVQGRYMEGTEERKKADREVFRLRNELASESYQKSLDWIEEEKYYNRLSLEEELAAWERVQGRYMEGTEERKKADREVFRLRNELADESYQKSLDWIEEEKYYNRLSLADELAAWKRVQSRCEKGSEARKKADREVFRLEKDISEAQQQYTRDIQSVQEESWQKRLELERDYANQVKSINEKLAQDIKALNDQYESALKSREDSLYRSYGLFDKVKEREEVSGETLMKNLEGQVKEFGEWQDILDKLSARGLDAALIEELQQMGPDAISQIKALNAMSDSELEKYASLWSVKHGQAREQAVEELKDLRVETQNGIAQLQIEADKELEEYRSIWQSKMAQVTEETNAELEQLQKDFGEKVGLIKTDTQAELAEMSETSQKILTEAGWDETGQRIVTELTTGVTSQRPSFINELTNMALAGVAAVNETLGIGASSGAFSELGNDAGRNFIEGLHYYTDQSYDAGADMAESAKSGFSNALQMVAGLVDDGVDMEPTIRPVLDLSDVSRQADELNALFHSQHTAALAGQASMTLRASAEKNASSDAANNENVVRELRSLRGDMSAMLTRMEGMRIVLSTGALVGELAEPMDAALGQRAAYKGRGI